MIAQEHLGRGMSVVLIYDGKKIAENFSIGNQGALWGAE
jgi:hypothetical protein